MNAGLDEQFEELRERLHATAVDVAESRAVLDAIRASGQGARASVPWGRRRIVTIVGAAALVAATLVIVALVGGTSSRSSVAPGTQPSTVPATAPVTTVAPERFDNISWTTFLDARHGWLLANRHSDGRLQLFATVDGTTWVEHPGPPLATPTISARLTFADQRNGWLWGDGWWSTHDGGTTWNRLPDEPDGRSPTDLATAGGFVYAVSFDNVASSPTFGSFTVSRSPVDADAFTPTGLSWPQGKSASTVHLEAAAQGSSVWFVFDDGDTRMARIVDGRVDTSWSPITSTDGRFTSIAVDPADGTLYLAARSIIDVSIPATVVRSGDDGATFSPVALPASAGAKEQRFCGLGVPIPGQLVAAMCDAAGVALFRSNDQGATWTSLSRLPATAGLVDFAPGGVATAVLSAPTPTVWLSTDGGATWRQSFPPAA